MTKRTPAYQQRAAALSDAVRALEWVRFTASDGREADYHYTHPEAPLTVEARAFRQSRIASLRAERQALFDGEPGSPVGAPKGTRGGRRPGAGRKRIGTGAKVTSVSLPAEMIEAIKAFGGGSLSAGVRRLHDELLLTMDDGR